MKTLILATALLLASFSAVTAQTVNDNIDKPVSNIHIELLGGSNGIGIQYDRRFKGNSAWGYGIGAGWGFSYSQSDFFRFKQNYQNLSVSPRMNYLLGRKNRKLELGVGMSIGYQFGTEEYDKLSVIYDSESGSYLAKTTHVKEKNNLMNYFFFANIGYRRQAHNGFLFRIGITPVFGFGGKHSIDKFQLVPYLGFGKSF